MDTFTDVDIFKEIVEASSRGISVYLLLDEANFSHFLKMTEKQGCQVQRLRVSHFSYERSKCLAFTCPKFKNIVIAKLKSSEE